MIRKTIFSLFLAIALFSTLAQAADFISTLTPVKTEITLSESAEIELITTNLQDIPDTVYVHLDDFNWDIQSIPLYHYFSGIKLGRNETAVSNIYLKPTSSVGIGRYIIRLDLTSRSTGRTVSKNIAITVKPYYTTPAEYIPAVDISAEVSESFDPRQPGEVRVSLKNRNPLNISDLSITVQSSLVNMYRETDLPPLFEKTEEFRIDLNPRQPPLKDELTITVKRGNDVLRVIKKSYQVQGYSVLDKDYEETRSFLKSEKMITVRNNGNIRNTGTVTLPARFLSSFYDKTYPQGTIARTIQGKVYQWEVVLDPDQTEDILLVSSYRPMGLLLLLVLLLIVAYYVFRSDIVVTKIASNIAMKEGGISEIKILVYVKNRSNHFMQDLSVIDRITHLAEVSSEHTVGTLAPTKILKHEKKGTMIRWDIEAIEGKEERILSYKMVTKLSILGHMSLTPTIVKFKDRKGNEKIASSNIAKV